MTSLVGYTGFVGSNIYAAGKKEINKIYNSKNIEEAFDTKPDLLIYAGIRAEKYLANTNPDTDMQAIYQAEENIRKINAKKLVLISTIDIFKNPNGKNEASTVETTELPAYGLNRYHLEQWTTQAYPEALIIRLPGLYGKNIKKNFIYDCINVIPFMLNQPKFKELTAKDKELESYYELQPNGFYKCKELTYDNKENLKQKFKNLSFTALNFTDSRSIYQFYPLSRLWNDIQTAIKADIKLWHPATEPVSAREIYKYLTNSEFVNELASQPAFYDYRTKYADIFGGKGEYLMTKEQVLKDIDKFVRGTEI